MPSISLTILGRDQSGQATGSAKANLESLQSTRDKVSQRAEAAQNREASAAGRVRVAQQQLTEAQAKYAGESSQVISAQERLEAAQRTLTASQGIASRSAAQLEAAESRLKTSIASAASTTEHESSRMGNALSGVGDHTRGILSDVGGWLQSGFAGILGGATASILSSVTSAIGQAASAVMTQLKSSAIDYNSALENATIGFTTMLGSGGKATDFLNTLQSFARRTPFQFGDLTQYAQQMIGYGIKSKDVIKDLSALGDAASGTGRLDTLGNAVLAFEQMAARGKVDLGDLNQLSNAGVPALKIMASEYGVTTGKMLKMISTGEVMSSDALPKLTKGIEKGTASTAKFGGMMDKQSGTFTGAMSNIHDALDQTLSTAFKPFYGMLEKGAVALSKFAGSKAVQNWSRDASRTVGSALKAIGGAIHSVFGDPKVQASVHGLGTALQAGFAHVGPTLKAMLPDAIRFGKTVLPAIVDAVTKVVKHMPAALDVIKRFGKLIADNAPFIAGLISGIGKLVSAFMDISVTADNAIIKVQGKFTGFRNWIGTFFSGAAGWLADAGRWIVQGLINGVSGMLGAAQDAMNGLVGGIVDGAKQFLGIASPSKVFTTIGRQVGQGLNLGLLGSVDQIKTASGKLADAVTSAFDAKHSKVTKSMEDRARRTLSAGSRTLERLAGTRAGVDTKLQGAESTLKSRRDERSQYAAGVASSDVAIGDVSAGYSTGGMIATLRQTLTRTKAFKSALDRLVKLGIDRTTYEQLVAAGVGGGGLTAATALLADTKGAREVFSLQRSLGTAAGSLGSDTAGHLYSAGVNAAQGIVDGLKHREKAIDSEMKHIAKSMVATLRRELGIRSPSTVMHAQMGHVVDGITGGLYDRKHEVAHAMGSILSVPSMGLSKALRSTSVVNAGGVGGGVHIGQFIAQGGQSPYDIARELDWRSRGR